MTDTVTREQVTATVETLRSVLAAEQHTFDTEEGEFARKRDAMVDIGHRAATDAGIGPAFDEMMREIGLPERLPRYEWNAAIYVAEPSAASYMRTENGAEAYGGNGGQIIHRLDASLYSTGEGCRCDDLPTIAEAVVSSLGSPRAAAAKAQVVWQRCGHPDCAHLGSRSSSAPNGPDLTRPFISLPVIPGS